jgi:DeoR/GlpR family transcriptional regulator of sugar metabolism
VLAEERRSRILRELEDAGALGTEDLARRLRVSSETIRRDLVRLGEQGHLHRVHGGAMIGTAVRGEEPSYAERAEVAAEAKRRVAQVAAGLLSTGQTVALDLGTTALAVARAFPPSFHGTVVTCSLLVAAELVGRPGLEVLVAGGRVRAGDLAVSNAQTIAFFRDVHPDVAFLGSGGVSAEAGVTDFHIDEIATKRVLIANARETYLLADGSKLGKVAAYRVCGLDEVTGVITDTQPARSLAAAIRDAGGRIVLPA